MSLLLTGVHCQSYTCGITDVADFLRIIICCPLFSVLLAAQSLHRCTSHTDRRSTEVQNVINIYVKPHCLQNGDIDYRLSVATVFNTAHECNCLAILATCALYRVHLKQRTSTKIAIFHNPLHVSL